MTTMTEHVRTNAQEPAEMQPGRASQGVPRARVMRDSKIALGLADMAPAEPSTRDVITRLRGHIEGSLDDAERFVLTIPKSTRRRSVVFETNRPARELIAASVAYGVPGARRRLHVMAADHLTQYAQAYRARRQAL